MSMLILLFLVLALAEESSPRLVTSPSCVRTGSCSSNDWRKSGNSAPTDVISIVLAVKQNSINELREYVDKISTPGPAYGKYLSFKEVVDATTSKQATRGTFEWLVEKQFGNIKYHTGGFFTCSHLAPRIESLFSAKMYTFTSKKSAQPIKRALSHVIPEEIENYVDFISGLSDFPAVAPDKHMKKFEGMAEELENSTTPSKLLHSYRIPVASPSGMGAATQAVFEALGQSYSPEDLFEFQSWAQLPRKDIDTINGRNDPSICRRDPESCAEANLDVQYMMAVAPYSPTTFWSVEGNGVDVFLNWIIDVASTSSPPLVHSISYGGPEPEFPEDIVRRVDDEFMKLGARGVTIVAASGDDGVAGMVARGNVKACGFAPSYPASLPHVVSVGATMGIETGSEEIACTSERGGLITTGGGFSVFFDAPFFQKKEGMTYLKKAVELPDTSLFNSEGRGYPDVSLAGHNYMVRIGGQFYQISGTSASAPVFAGMLSLINGRRIQRGLPPVGWATPALWHIASVRPSVFRDVTEGRNNCCAGTSNADLVCCPNGFTAAAGWDPVCGFGSVNFEELLSEWSEL